MGLAIALVGIKPALAFAGPADAGAREGLPGAVVWRRVAELPRSAHATALAVDVASGEIAVGDAEGVLRVRPAGRVLRVLRRGGVRDLVYLARGDLLAATDQGVYRVDASGRSRPVSPGPGAARRALRLSTAADVVAAATEGGAFLSLDAERWQPIPGLPSGPALAVAVRTGAGGFECFALVRAALHRVDVGVRSGELVIGPVRREAGAPSLREAPVDVVAGLGGSDLALLFPWALAVRDTPDAGWRLLRPTLPPGAIAHRLVEGLGRLWLATDRGLLEAERPSGPWARVAASAGARGVVAVSAGAGSVHAVVGDAVFSADAVRRDPPRGVLAELPADPPIQRVHRVALDYLGLEPARIEEMRRGVRRRGWLPQVELAGGLSHDRDRGSDVDESIVSGALRQLVDRDEGSSRDRDVSLRFTWDVADLAYHPEQIDVSREAREVIELRDDVLDEITQLYFERRRVLVELAAAETPVEALRLRLRAQELAAGIDAWTGGWFSRALHGSAP